jgi:hypothetical protein
MNIEEVRASEHFWECLKQNIPFEYQFSEEYLKKSAEKFQAQGWKVVENSCQIANKND